LLYYKYKHFIWVYKIKLTFLNRAQPQSAMQQYALSDSGTWR